MRKSAILLIKFYQKFLSPDQGYLGRILGTAGLVCRFTPTCSQYALEALEKYPFLKALRLGLKRLSRCHPLSEGGWDPVV